MKTRISTSRLIAITLLSSAAATMLFAATGVVTPDKARLQEKEPRGDHPDEAFNFRQLQLQDENGKIPADGIEIGRRQVALMRSEQNRQAVAAGESPDKEIAGIDPGSWTPLGPGNIGGRIRSIVFDPTNENSMWVGSVGGGIWHSVNGGSSWGPVNDFQANLAVSTMVINPVDPSVLYAGTGESFAANTGDTEGWGLVPDGLRGDGVFKSTDGGVTWSRLPSTRPTDPVVCAAPGGACPWSYVNRLSISPDGSKLLAATVTGIQRSTDGGVTWTLGAGLVGQVLDIDFDPANNQKAIASGYSASAFSTNGGAAWTLATYTPAIAKNGATGRVELAYAPSNPQIVYASVDQNDVAPPAPPATQGDIYKSTDGGQTFTKLNAVNPGNTFMGSQGGYDNIIWVNPLDPNFVIVGGVNMYRSIDGGLNWTPIASGAFGTAHSDHHTIVASPLFDNTANKKVFFGNDGGIYGTNDVATVCLNDNPPVNCISNGWFKLNNNLGITQFYGAAVNSNGVIVGGTQDNGNLKYSGIPNDWHGVSGMGGDGGYVVADPSDPNYFYGEYIYAQIGRSNNEGVSGGDIYNGITDAGDKQPLPQTANFIAPMTLDPGNPNTMLVGGVRLWRSSDVKAATPTWTVIKTPIQVPTLPGPTPSPTPPAFVPISAIAISSTTSDLIAVGHNDGQIFLTFNGTDTNPLWINISNGTPARYVTRLVIDETRSPSWIYATFGGFSEDNIYRSADLGATWTNVSGTGIAHIPSVPVRGLAINPVRRDFLYAATEIGVFASEDGGTTWKVPQDGPANVSVDDLFWNSGSLIAVTHGRGLYSTGSPVYSTNGGGGGGTGISCPLNRSNLWHDPLMWSSGHVPTFTEDVAVVCPIKITSGGGARNLRVNSTVTLRSSLANGLVTTQDIGNFGIIQRDTSLPGSAEISCRNLSNNSGSLSNINVINATGDLVNGGSITLAGNIHSTGLRNPGVLTAENVTIDGDLDNSGSMVGTGPVGSGVLFLGGFGAITHNFSGSGQLKFSLSGLPQGQSLRLLTDMTWDIGEFNSNGTMDFGSRTLRFLGGSFSNTGSVPATGVLRLEPTLGTVVLDGNAPTVRVVSGLASYQSAGTFSGPLTVDAGATFRLSTLLTLKGDATVNGAMTRDAAFASQIKFFGSTFTNIGGVTVDWVRFNPSGPAPLLQNIVGSGVWTGDNVDIGNGSLATPSTVKLQNDVTFAVKEISAGYTLDLNGHVLTYTGTGSQFGVGLTFFGSVAGPGTFRMQPPAGSPIIRSMSQSAKFGAELKIASGSVTLENSFANFVVTGPLTVDAGATFRLSGDFSSFDVRNNLVNNGSINMLNSTAALNFRGSSFTNNGSIDAANVNFRPLAAQQMDLSGSGTWTGAGTLYLDTLASTRFTSDVTYGSGSLQTYGPLQGVDPSIFSVPCTVPWTGPGEVTGNIRRTNLAACPGAAVSYGNPFTTIAFNSGTPPSEVLVSVVSSPLVPPGFPGAVQRLYTITPTGGSGYSATLRLHYLDSELNGNNESTLLLWRNDGTNWITQGATNRNTTDNWVEYAGVTQFSPWTFSSSNSGCTFSLNLASQNFVSDGGSGIVNVTSQSGCDWTAVSNDPGFIDITSGNSGNGNGTVNYTVSPNFGPARSGTISISGQTFTVNQDPGCSFSISPTSRTFSPAGVSDNIAVTSSCDWTAVSNESWITINSGASGTGDGIIAYSVAANAGALRAGTITVTPAFGSPWTFSAAQGSSTPTCTTPPTEMVSWWPGAGNANDIRGTNHGTLENGVTFTTGQVGQAFGFDGVDDSVLLPAINLGSAFTVEFWIYPTAATGDYQHLVSNSWTSANYGALYFFDDHLEYYQNGQYLAYAGNVPLNTWTHVALTYDNSVDRLYVNGTLADTSTIHTETLNNQMRLGFTMGSPEGSHFQGLLDEVTLFGRALTIAEVQFVYLAGGAGKCQDPAATPTPTPVPIAISGTITYCSNPVHGPVPNVTLNLTGSGSASTLSDSSGNYALTSLVSGGNYVVTPTKTALIPASTGINTVDVIATQRHFLNLGTPLLGCRLTAADVNLDTSVNTVDVIAIQRFFLGLSTGLAQTGKYKFTPVNRTYTGLVTNQTAQNFDALVYGDVASSFVNRPEGQSQDAATDSASVSALSGLNTSVDEVPAPVATLSLPNVSADAFVTNFNVQVTTSPIDAKNKLVGFQGDVTFDERVVSFQSEPVQKAGITSGNWNVSGNVLAGAGPIRTLRISAYSLDFTALSGSGTLFELRMSKVSKAAQGTQLLWAAPPDNFIFIDADLNAQKPRSAVPGSVTPSGKRE